jgi:hypothetical protein
MGMPVASSFAVQGKAKVHVFRCDGSVALASRNFASKAGRERSLSRLWHIWTMAYNVRMPAVFTPRLDILPSAQRRLWDELGEIPEPFVLYGGTAIALQLGHRASEDFDFFSDSPLDPGALLPAFSFLRGAAVTQRDPDTLSCIVDRGGPVKVSFFGVPRLKRLHPPLVAPNGVRLASLHDLAGAKARVVQVRAEAKDYIDIDALCGHGISLIEALSCARTMYGADFNPQITLKALCFFGEGSLPALPQALRTRLVTAVAGVDLNRLPQIEGDS